MEAFGRMRSTLINKSIYFDFDKYAIRPEADPLISEHAKLLSAYSNDYLTLQGNCDERGSSEYNRALGQRRVDAVKQRLVLLGVPETHIETISFGKAPCTLPRGEMLGRKPTGGFCRHLEIATSDPGAVRIDAPSLSSYISAR